MVSKTVAPPYECPAKYTSSILISFLQLENTFPSNLLSNSSSITVSISQARINKLSFLLLQSIFSMTSGCWISSLPNSMRIQSLSCWIETTMQPWEAHHPQIELQLVIFDPSPWLKMITFHFQLGSESLVQRVALPSTGIFILNRYETMNLKIRKGINLSSVGSTKNISQRSSLYFQVGIHLQCQPSDIDGQNTLISRFQWLQQRYPALQGPFPTISIWQSLIQAMSSPSRTTKTVWSSVRSRRSARKTMAKMGVYGRAPSKVKLTMATKTAIAQKQCLCQSSMMIMLSRQKRNSRSFSMRKYCLLILYYQQMIRWYIKLILKLGRVGQIGFQPQLVAQYFIFLKWVIGLQYLFTLMNKAQKDLVHTLVFSGVIKNPEVAKIMEKVDRKYYSPYPPYEDTPQPIGYGATISAPHMHAYALQLLYSKLTTAKYSLDIGSGTGYLTAAMAMVVPPQSKVFGIEHVPQLVKKSIENIKKGNPELMEKVRIEAGDGRLGWTQDKDIKFDVIHVGAAAEKMPEALVEQLAEGGKMIIPVGGINQCQKFVEITKKDGKIEEKFILSVRYVPLTDLKQQLI